MVTDHVPRTFFHCGSRGGTFLFVMAIAYFVVKVYSKYFVKIRIASFKVWILGQEGREQSEQFPKS